MADPNPPDATDATYYGGPVGQEAYGNASPHAFKLPPQPERRGRLIKSADGKQARLMESPAGTVRKANRVGRNDPCPCGSGKKYKKCHGSNTPKQHQPPRRKFAPLIQGATTSLLNPPAESP